MRETNSRSPKKTEDNNNKSSFRKNEMKIQDEERINAAEAKLIDTK